MFSSVPTKTTKESLSAKDVNLKEAAVTAFSLCVTTVLACDQYMIWLYVYCYHIFMPSPSDGLPYADRSFEHRQKVSFSFLQMV